MRAFTIEFMHTDGYVWNMCVYASSRKEAEKKVEKLPQCRYVF